MTSLDEKPHALPDEQSRDDGCGFRQTFEETGFPKNLIKRLVDCALEGEMAEHIGYLPYALNSQDGCKNGLKKGSAPISLRFFITLALAIPASSAFADTIGEWSGATPTAYVQEDAYQPDPDDPEAKLTFSAFGADIDIYTGHLDVNIGLDDKVSGENIPWNDPSSWDSLILPLVYHYNKFMHPYKGSTIVVDSQTNEIDYRFNGLDGFVNGGPSNTTVSVPLSFILKDIVGPVHLNLGTRVLFSATIDGNRGVNLNQDATLQNLIVAPGSSIESPDHHYLTLNEGLVNNGLIHVDSLNMGSIGIAGNAGTLIIDGGTFNPSNTFSNDGDLELKNSADASVQGDLINRDTIVQDAGTVVEFQSGGTLTNRGVYEVQSGGTFRTAYGNNHGYIDNSGTFRKSGEGVAGIANPGVAFNNTGTVEVTGGTLTFGGISLRQLA